MDFEIYVGDAGERLSAPFGPDLLVVLQGESSDEDPYFSLVRIELYLDEERPGRVQVITGPEMVDSNRFNPVNILRGDADLRSEESQDLLQWLQTLAPDDLKDVPYKGGGYPCSIAVLDRDGIRGRGSCVLIGTSPEHAGDPTCLLVCRVFGLAERVSNSPLIAGWKAPIEAPRESEFDFVHAKARLADSDAPDWIVLLHYRALPLRGPYSFWLELSDGTVPAGLLKTVDRHYPNSAEDPRHAFATLVLILTQEQAETMLQFLRPLKRRALTSLPSNAVDGASCQITVLRRQPRMVQKGDCNLGGLRDEDRDSPTPQLIRLLLQVARETQSTPPNPSADDAAN